MGIFSAFAAISFGLSGMRGGEGRRESVHEEEKRA